jgi:hydroxyacylglutathione hydrolase
MRKQSLKLMAREIDRFIDKRLSIRLTVIALLVFAVLFKSSPAWSQLVPGSMDVHWNEGSANCAKDPQPPLQQHQYNSGTFILRENLCTTFEAPFMYLLVGSTKALLIDSGDIADPNVAPLAESVMHLLPGEGAAKLPLLVVHTHRHLDHRAGDVQFARFTNAQVVGFDIDSVRNFYKFTDWPNGLAQIDLGDRTVDVIPTPGHNETEVSFYDRSTGLLFTGDFLMPARLLIDNTSADIASAERVATFVERHPISFVLGGHIEMNSAGDLFPWESQYHPQEHVLQMAKDDALALPAAVHSFNGFYTVHGPFTMENSMRILTAFAVLVLILVVAVLWALIRYIRRRRRARKVSAEIHA